MSKFTTWTGATLEFDKLEKYKPDIRDVAHALSLLGRYRGHTDEMYSVGLHSLLVENILMCQEFSPRVRKAGLLHDAPEMLISDCPSPLKKLMPEFVAFEKKIGGLFDDHFNINTDLEEVHEADKLALYTESYCLFPGVDNTHYEYTDLFETIDNPKIVEQKFLAKYWELEYLILLGDSIMT